MKHTGAAETLFLRLENASEASLISYTQLIFGAKIQIEHQVFSYKIIGAQTRQSGILDIGVESEAEA